MLLWLEPMLLKEDQMAELVTNEEVARIIENEGMGYAIMWYLNAAQIEDSKLASLWQQASVLLRKIEKHLEPWFEDE